MYYKLLVLHSERLACVSIRKRIRPIYEAIRSVFRYSGFGSKSVKRKLKFVLVWLSCGQTTAIGKPLCCLYRHAKLPTNWINRFLPYEPARVPKITKTTVPELTNQLLICYLVTAAETN